MPEFPGFTSLVQSLPTTVPFVGPETQERATGKLYRARLGANESGFGPAPSVKEAMRASAEEVWKYCDPENHELREALASHFGLAPGNVMIGEGIDGLQALAVRQVVLPGNAGRHLARCISNLQFPRCREWRSAGHGALSRRQGGSGGAARVHRQGFCDGLQPDLREGAAYPIGLIMRWICGKASAWFRWSCV